MATKYVLTHNGAEVDSAVGRALPGGGIDASLSNKANKTPPTEYDLPLASGFTVSGALKYFKAQDNIVTIYGAAVASATIPTGGQVIATLPVGYRPSYGFTVPATVAASSQSIQAATLEILASGTIKVYTNDATCKYVRIIASFVAGN